MKDKSIKIVEDEFEAVENGGVRFKITPEAALRTVREGLGIQSVARDLLIKGLDEIKIKNKVQIPGKQIGKDEYGIPMYENTEEKVEEVLSDFQKGYVIFVPDNQTAFYREGDIIIYRLKGATIFDWKEGLFLVQPYDVVGKAINKN